VSAVGELEGEEGVLQGQWEALRRVYEEFNSKLVNYSKPKLILEYPTLLDNLSEIPTLLL
jgi:hypothetical protein